MAVNQSLPVGLLSILEHVLRGTTLRQTQRRFLTVVLSVFLAVPGRLNAVNLSRYAGCSDRTIRRWLHRTDKGAIPWWSLQLQTVQAGIESGLISPLFVLAIDASFHRKAGTKTDHIGAFWNGSTGHVEQGIEQSCCALVEVQHRQAFPIHARQTQTQPEAGNRMAQAIRQLDDVLHGLRALPQLEVAAVVADGNYAHQDFVQAMTCHGLPVVSKMQRNADLKYVKSGEHEKRRGRPKKYDGKVTFDDLSRFEVVSETNTERVLTQVVWRTHWNLPVRVVVVQQLNRRGQVSAYAVLFSTAVHMPAHEVVAFYKSRFEIELIFRDQKQFLGGQDAQVRAQPALEAHWNMVMLMLNVARLEALRQAGSGQGLVFHLEDMKRRAYNALFAEVILSQLGLDAYFHELHTMPSSPLNFGLKAA